MILPALPNLKHLPYGGAQYVVSDTAEQQIKKYLVDSADALWSVDLQSKFLDRYKSWIAESKKNFVTGIAGFNMCCFSAGTTESFDKFYLKNLHRRLRYFRGEYMYHAVASRNFSNGGCFLEDDAVREGDAVIISCPFSDTGEQHPDMDHVLDQCDRLGIPVLLDMAYFGICSGLIFDLDHPSITDVTFSLSKTFPVPHLRIGMRLSRDDDDDTLIVMNKTNYTNRIAMSVGLRLLEESGPDHIFEMYRPAQLTLCHDLKVRPSSCVIFGIDTNNLYPEYNRGTATNRLCLSKYLDKMRFNA